MAGLSYLFPNFSSAGTRAAVAVPVQGTGAGAGAGAGSSELSLGGMSLGGGAAGAVPVAGETEASSLLRTARTKRSKVAPNATVAAVPPPSFLIHYRNPMPPRLPQTMYHSYVEPKPIHNEVPSLAMNLPRNQRLVKPNAMPSLISARPIVPPQGSAAVAPAVEVAEVKDVPQPRHGIWRSIATHRNNNSNVGNNRSRRHRSKKSVSRKNRNRK